MEFLKECFNKWNESFLVMLYVMLCWKQLIIKRARRSQREFAVSLFMISRWYSGDTLCIPCDTQVAISWNEQDYSFVSLSGLLVKMAGLRGEPEKCWQYFTRNGNVLEGESLTRFACWKFDSGSRNANTMTRPVSWQLRHSLSWGWDRSSLKPLGSHLRGTAGRPK